MIKESKKTLEGLGFKLPNIRRRINDLSGGQRKGVAIARAVHWDAKLLIMDEPTAALGVAGRKQVYSLIEDLRKNKIAIIYVSLNVKEVFKFADRIIVIRVGKLIARRNTKDSNVNEIVSFIVGSKEKE